PGLKSRFTHFIDFEDWTTEDCLHLFKKRAKGENFRLEAAADMELQEGFSALRRLDGWGNARDVDKVWKASLQQRADRVVHESEGLEKTIQARDVKPALETLLEARRVKAAPTMPSFSWEHLPMKLPEPRCQETPVQKQAFKEQLAKETEVQPNEDEDARDAGISDETWANLQRAKEAFAQQEESWARKLREMEERAKEEEARREEELRKEMEENLKRLAEEVEQARLEEERLRLQAELEKRLEEERRERERLRLEELRRIREEQARQQAIREKLRQISPCPAGFHWPLSVVCTKHSARRNARITQRGSRCRVDGGVVADRILSQMSSCRDSLLIETWFCARGRVWHAPWAVSY
ncbi:unnamed protein product, partial [Durusdinium trenchii]